MSAYGDIARGASTGIALAPRMFALPETSNASLAVIHLDGKTVPASVVEYLHQIFNATVAHGRTYPQEAELSAEAFAAYYLSADLFLGVLISRNAEVTEEKSIELPATTTLTELINGRPIEDCLGGMYYVKPNYPGRSSHLCNAGFVVAGQRRGAKIGLALGRSFLHFAPKLGYRGSIFNLVYANNLASLAIWDRLGFVRAGLIPGAGRLRTADGQGEEYVDAIVYHRSFV